MRRRWMIWVGALVALLPLGCAYNGGAASGMRAATKPDMAPCTTDADCVVPTYASVGPGGECQVQMRVETVTVGRGVHPFVVWRLEKADPRSDRHDYRFAAVGGVRIVGNDRARDFDLPGYQNGDERSFVWRSRNERPVRLDYTMAVQRRASDTEPWTDCALLDPRIVNEGP